MTKRSDQAEPTVFGCFSVQSVADAYQKIYLPRIFIPWGKRLIERAQLQPGDAVLDVATGPGTVARLAAERVGPRGRVVGADISPAMIAIANGKPPVPGGAALEYVVSPAAPLAVPDEAFDVVTCQQGLQFFPDRGAAIAEMHRALRRNGRLVAAVWREIALQPSFAALDAVLRECLPWLTRNGPRCGRSASGTSAPWSPTVRSERTWFRISSRRESVRAPDDSSTGCYPAAASLSATSGTRALGPRRVARNDPSRIKTKPAPAPSVKGSFSITMPSSSATAGLK